MTRPGIAPHMLDQLVAQARTDGVGSLSVEFAIGTLMGLRREFTYAHMARDEVRIERVIEFLNDAIGRHETFRDALIEAGL